MTRHSIAIGQPKDPATPAFAEEANWFGKATGYEWQKAEARNVPVEMVRLAISGQKVDRNYEASWNFYCEIAQNRQDVLIF